MRHNWRTINFVERSWGENKNKLVINQLEDYLNENNISDFKVIFSKDKYLEIAYKLDETNNPKTNP